MIVVTTENLPGHRVCDVKGQCFGVVVRRRCLGGKIREHIALLQERRRHAIDRLTRDASLMGTDAVVRTRFDSNEIDRTMNAIVAYGTAAVLEPVSI